MSWRLIPKKRPSAIASAAIAHEDLRKYSAPLWLKQRPTTASSHEQSASKERCKHWKRFNRSSPFKVTATGCIGETCTSNSSTLSQLIALPTGQIALNRDYANAGRRNTIRCWRPGTQSKARRSNELDRTTYHSTVHPRHLRKLLLSSLAEHQPFDVFRFMPFG